MAQIVVMSMMIYMGSNGKVNSKKKKKRQDPFNNVSMVLCFLVTVVNIFITVFQGNQILNIQHGFY